MIPKKSLQVRWRWIDQADTLLPLVLVVIIVYTLRVHRQPFDRSAMLMGQGVDFLGDLVHTKQVNQTDATHDRSTNRFQSNRGDAGRRD